MIVRNMYTYIFSMDYEKPLGCTKLKIVIMMTNLFVCDFARMPILEKSAVAQQFI